MRYLSWSSGKPHDTVFASISSNCRGRASQDRGGGTAAGQMAPYPLLLMSGTGPSWQVTEEGKMAQFSRLPQESYCQPQWAAGTALAGRTPEFRGLGLLAHQERESYVLPGACSPTPSSSPLCPKKSLFCSSVCFASVYRVQHLVKMRTQLSRTFGPWERACLGLC